MNDDAVRSVSTLAAQAARLEDHARGMRDQAREARERIHALAEQLEALPLVDILTDMRRFSRLVENGGRAPTELPKAAE